MLLALALLAWSSGLCVAPQFGQHPDLQPCKYKSPDGRWSLAVNPTHRDGSGPGEYVLAHDGKPVWSGEKPWTFWNAAVTDEGFVAGYSYSQGGLEMFAKGEFHVVILASDGTVKLDEAHAREPSRYEHGSPNPRANGLLLLPGSKRVVFRIADADLNRCSEEWWCFQLPDAKEVFRRRPRESFPSAALHSAATQKDEEPSLSLHAAQEVPGTALILIEWSLFDYPSIGLAISLHDAELQCCWNALFPRELNDPDEGREERTSRFAYEHGTLLPSPTAATFAIGLPHSQTCIRYVIDRETRPPAVREGARDPWKIPQEEEGAGPRFEDLPLVSPKELESFDLQMATAAQGAVHDVCAFAVSAPDALRFVRHEEKTRGYSLLRVDLKGSVLAEQPIELRGRLEDIAPQFWELGPSSWLATQSPYGEGGRSRAWRIDERGGVVTPLEGFACDEIDAVAPLGENAFVALATRREKYTMTKGLFAFDANGGESWHVWEDMNSDAPGALFSPEAIAVTTDRRVVVLDVIRHTLQYFRADGQFDRVLNLDRLIGKEAEYPSGLQPDIDGGLLVHDFNGTPPLHRLKLDGSLRSSLSPHFPDGRVVDGLTRNARVAPDGRLWATDGRSLLRMNEQGVVDLQVGTKADTDVLAAPSASTIDVFGRVLVQDQTTGAVHVFDGKGKRLFVCRPDPTDFKDPDSVVHLSATRERGVLAEAGDGFDAPYVEFASDGTRKRKQSFGDGLGNPVCSPRSDAVYVGKYGEGFVRLGDAKRPEVRFERAPDGYWLEGSEEPAIGPDGSVAVVSSLGLGGATGGRILVLFESGEPAAGHSVQIPADTDCSCVAVGSKWTAVSGYGSEALLVPRRGGNLQRFKLSSESKQDASCRFGFDPESDEMLVYDCTAHRLHRFAKP